VLRRMPGIDCGGSATSSGRSRYGSSESDVSGGRGRSWWTVSPDKAVFIYERERLLFGFPLPALWFSPLPEPQTSILRTSLWRFPQRCNGEQGAQSLPPRIGDAGIAADFVG